MQTLHIWYQFLDNFVYFHMKKKVNQNPQVQIKMTADLEKSLFRLFIDANFHEQRV